MSSADDCAVSSATPAPRNPYMENRPIVGDDPGLYAWNEITDAFRGACKELSLGELQHDSSFSLFEGMSAIELMDPKMDAGMVHRSAASLGFDNAVHGGKLKLADVSYPDLLITMDSTFAAIVALYEGHSLAQTIFTNLYLHKPHLIEDRILKAFSICVLKLVAVSYDVIRRANVCEEEDFQQVLYNFDLAGDVSENRAIGMVKEAEDDCQKIIRGAKGKLTEETKLKIEQCEAISERLRFVRQFLVALISLTVKEDKSLGQSAQGGGALPKCQNIEEAKRNLQNCEASIAKMSASSILDDVLPEDDYNYKSVYCIEPHVNQRLLPPTFPRHTKFLRPPEVFDYLFKLVQRLTVICSLPEHVTTFGSVLLSLMSSQSKGVLNKIPFVDLVKEAIREFIQPPVLNLKYTLMQDPQCKGLLDDFLKNCCRVLAELLRVCGHNRARQRDYYAVVLEDLGSLQEEADRLDAHLHSVLNHGAVVTAPGRHHLACLGSFVLYHVLKAMIEYLLLGFELELYSVHEFAYVYWYTNEFLFKWLVNVLHKADNFVYEQEQFQSKQEKVKGDNKKKNRPKKKPTKSHRFEIMQLQSKQKLCEGYYRAMLGFYASNRIRTPTFANSDDNDAIRYDHRLAPFGHMATPPMIGYHQYLEISNLKEIVMKIQPSRLFVDSAHCFEEARMGFENIPPVDEQENTALVKITKLNTVVLKLLASGHSDGSNSNPSHPALGQIVFVK